MRSPRVRPTATDVASRLASQVLVCDGAMGTMLHAGGVSLDRSLPELNLSHADLVRSIHRAYIAAGADIIETNTFGASRLRLARHGLARQVAELNRAGVQAAREARDAAASETGQPSRASYTGQPGQPGRGGQTAPAARGGQTAPAGRGGQTAPAGRGGQTAPAARGGQTAPAARGGQTAPAGRGGQAVGRGGPVGVSSAGVLVAGSVSPATPAGLGHRLATRELRDAFREQIDALYDGGVDLLLFETFGSLAELIEAIEVAQSLGPTPIVAQMTFVEDGRTLGGDSPEEVATSLTQLGVAALGANCTLGPQGLLDILTDLARWTTLPLTAQPNAGPPTLTDGRFQYTSSDPAYFGRQARRFVELGATLVGGCCGTTPAHIEAVANAVRGVRRTASAPPQAGLRVHTIESRGNQPPDADGAHASALLETVTRGELVVACELPPPVGADAQRAVADAQALKAAGCHAVIVGPVESTRVQASPASIALLVQQRVPDLEVILTATTWDKSLMVLQADLLGTYAFGIRHVVCRTGTPPLHGDYPNAAGVWDVDSLGLIEVLRGLNEGHDYNGIPVGRPTSFVIGARINPAADDFAHEVATAQHKLRSGADFFVTPPVYDLEALERLLDAIALPSDVPVLLGLMPLQDLRHAEYLQNEVPDMSVPSSVLERMCRAGESGPAVGRDVAMDLFRAARSRGRVHGVVLSSASGQASEMALMLSALRA